MTIEFIDPRDAPGGLGPIWQGNADNDTPALQWAINQGKATGGRVMLPASAVGRLHAPIDCTSNNLPAARSLTIEGYGNSFGGSRVIFVTGTNAIGFDCVGARRISLRRFWYTMGVQLFAGIVISASTARACDKTLFSELRGDGPTAMGAFYGYAWGSSGVERCEFYNTSIGDRPTVTLTGANRYGVASTFATIVTGYQGVTGIDWSYNEIHDQGQSTYSSCLMLDDVDTFKIWGGNMGQLAGGSPCQGYIQIAGTPGHGTKNIFSRGCQYYMDAGPMTQYIAVAPAPFTGTNFQFPDNDNMFSYSVAKFGGNITS
jgi:hypothetical protein